MNELKRYRVWLTGGTTEKKYTGSVDVIAENETQAAVLAKLELVKFDSEFPGEPHNIFRAFRFVLLDSQEDSP
jgi:hypothetical protein